MIRPLQQTDLEPVLTLAAACPEAPQWEPSSYAAYLAPDPNSHLLRTALVVIDPANQPAGIHAFAAATLLLDGEQNLCQLDSIVVHPDARRQGIGARLLRALLAWATQSGAHHFSLEVRAGNTPAIALYQRLGLRPEGRRPRYYTHPEEDALILGRVVTPDSSPASFPR